MGGGAAKETSWTLGKDDFQRLMSRLEELTNQKQQSDRQIAGLKQQTQVLKQQNSQMLTNLQKQMKQQMEETQKQLKQVTMASNKQKLNDKEKLLESLETNLKNAIMERNNTIAKYNQILKQIEIEKSQLLAKWGNYVDHDINDEKEQKTFASIDSIEGMVEDTKMDLINQNIDQNIESLKQQLTNTTVIVCLGKTGLGKSTFLNRFYGDSSDEGNEGCFKVGEEVKSETSQVSHKICKINGKKYCLVDTPGSLDTENRDKQHKRNISEYLRGCGGVNAFLVFFSLAEERVDASYIQLLNEYSKKFNNQDWWKHVILICTHYDDFIHKLRYKIKKIEGDQSQIDKFVANKKIEVRDAFMKNKQLNIPKNTVLPMISIGHESYKPAIKNVIDMVQQEKFVCDNIESPLTSLELSACECEQSVEMAKTECAKILNQKTQLLEEIEMFREELGMGMENKPKQEANKVKSKPQPKAKAKAKPKQTQYQPKQGKSKRKRKSKRSQKR